MGSQSGILDNVKMLHKALLLCVAMTFPIICSGDGLIIDITNELVELELSTNASNWYGLESSADLESWTTEEQFSGTNSVLVRTRNPDDADRMFYRLSELQTATDAYYVDADNINVDIHTLQSFQGVVNRSGPLLYVLRYEECRRWVDYINEHYSGLIQFTELPDAAAVFTHPALSPLCNTLVVYDKDDSGLAINGALTLAGIHGAAVVENDELATMQSYGFTVADDRRGYADWSTNEKVNEWALTNRHLTADSNYCVSLGLIAGRNQSIDLAVQQNMLVWMLDSNGEYLTDQFVQNQILSLFPPHSIAAGWWSTEVKDVDAISAYGHTFATRAINCSFFNHFQNRLKIRNQQVNDAPLPVYDPAKTYCFVSFSQGDALRFCSTRNLNHWTGISDDGSGRLVREIYPFGLQHSSLQAVFQPIVPDYLYRTQSPHNQFFAAKAYGYANPTTLWDAGYLAEHLDRGATALQEMDIRDVMINDRALINDNGNALLEYIAAVMDPKPRSFIVKHPLNNATDEDDEPQYFNGVPAFGDPVFNRDLTDGTFDLTGTLDAIAASMAQRDFFWVFLDNNTTVAELEDLMVALASDARFANLETLNPDTFIRLYQSLNPPTMAYTLADDAYVDENSPDTNRGDETGLSIRGGGSGQQRIAYLKFHIETDSLASYNMLLKIKTGAAAIPALNISRVDDTSWTEETITWNTRPVLGPVVASLDSLNPDSHYVIDLSDEITAPGTYTFALTTSSDTPNMSVMSRESTSPAAMAGASQFLPLADTRVHEDDPTGNYGTSDYLRIRGTGSGMEIISYLKFDVWLPTSAASQILVLHTGTKELEDVTVHSVIDSTWEEGTLNYSNRPALGSAIATLSNLAAEASHEFDLGSHITTNGIYTFALKTTVDAATRNILSRESGKPPVLRLIP